MLSARERHYQDLESKKQFIKERLTQVEFKKIKNKHIRERNTNNIITTRKHFIKDNN